MQQILKTSQHTPIVGRRTRRALCGWLRAGKAILCASVLMLAIPSCKPQAASGSATSAEVPVSELPAHSGAVAPQPCAVEKSNATSTSTSSPESPATQPGTNPQPAVTLPLCPPLAPPTDWFARFIDGPQTRHMTPREKAWLAMRDVADPFNSLTILASSALTIGTDSHTPFGPGMAGFGRYVGVSYTQDMTGEFLGTFLIPSIAHQDPHYHRWPRAGMKRRIAHAAYQVLWTQGDNGHEMVNYANIVGFAAEDEIANLYVPGRQTNLPASAERYGYALLSAPINNYITEFLPDIARHIHTRVVAIQRIINQVAKTGGPQ